MQELALPISAHMGRVPYHVKNKYIPSKAGSVEHLRQIAKELPPILDIPIGLFTGTDCPEALTPMCVLLGEVGQMLATVTMFDRTLCGGKVKNMQIAYYRSCKS